MASRSIVLGYPAPGDVTQLQADVVALEADVDALQTGKADALQDIVTVSGTSHTVQASDVGKLLDCTSGSPVTITVPDTFSIEAGKRGMVSILQSGAGQVTVVGSGTRAMTSNGLTNKTRGQGAEIHVSLRGSTVARVGGDVAVA